MKKLKSAQKATLIVFILICVSILFVYWYKQTNSPNLDGKLLIAKTSSPFKDSVTSLILDHYKSTSVAAEVIDINDLTTTDVDDYDAVFILHRWEAGAPANVVKSFVMKNTSLEKKIVVMTTSWNGLEKMENVDAITGASIIENVPKFSNKVVKRLDFLLK